MSYYVESLSDEAIQFDTGMNLLVSGPSMLSSGRLYDLIADGLDEGESAILITTDAGAGKAVDELARRTDISPDRLGIIDATGEAENPDIDRARVRTLGSPGDLTGLSLEFAKLLNALQDAGTAEKVRVGVASVSTLLMYAEVRTVFRFLHVFTSRIRSAGFFGAFAVDPGMHDDQTVNTVRAIFDAEAEVGDADVDLRGSGFTQK